MELSLELLLEVIQEAASPFRIESFVTGEGLGFFAWIVEWRFGFLSVDCVFLVLFTPLSASLCLSSFFLRLCAIATSYESAHNTTVFHQSLPIFSSRPCLTSDEFTSMMDRKRRFHVLVDPMRLRCGVSGTGNRSKKVRGEVGTLGEIIRSSHLRR